MSEHVASVESLIGMGSSVLRYLRGGGAIQGVSTWLVLSLQWKLEFGAQIPEGGAIQEVSTWLLLNL